jgi:hypothetical protein
LSDRSRRLRLGAFVLLVAVTVAVALAAVLSAAEDGASSDEGPAASANIRLPQSAFVIFRSLDRRNGAAEYGDVSFASLSSPSRRRIVGLRCLRVYYAAGRGLCLAEKRSFPPAYEAKIFDRRFQVARSVELQGFPSRARISSDGRHGAVTTFVTGHSYAQPGEFSTRTVLLDLVRGKELAELEQFQITRNGERIRSPDFNFWGVTFARNGERFYATLASGGKTFLIAGDVRSKKARVLRENVECPSLSPDGKRIGYKKLVGDPGLWRFYVLDLVTGRETPLSEERSVDDQIEWLNADNLLYRLDEEIWRVRADGKGQPRRYLAAADSPAVVE